MLFGFYLISAETGHHFLSDEYINEINGKQSLWRAGRNFNPETSLTYLRRLLGVKKQLNADLSELKPDQPIWQPLIDLPDQFDPREKWPECDSIRKIYDQGSCGSCWVSFENNSIRICYSCQ